MRTLALISPRRRREIVECYRAGHGMPVIAARARLTQYAVRRVLMAAGEPIRSHRAANACSGAHRRSPADMELAVEMYRRGDLLCDIYRRTCTHPVSLFAALRAAGVPLRGRKGKTVVAPHLHTAICARYLAGESSTALADAFGCSAPRIVAILRRHGVPRRNASQRRLCHR